jgi:hypothetical protein
VNDDPRATALLDAAISYAAAGWPVIPVALPVQEWGGAVPVRRLVVGRPAPDGQVARDWWADRPYGIALRAGAPFDVLTVPARVGPAIVAHFPPGAMLAAEHPDGRWLLLVTPGARLTEDLPRRCGVTLHGAGSHILLPPTPVADGELSWAVRPDRRSGLVARDGSIRAPHSLTVQAVAARLLFAERIADLRHAAAASSTTDPPPPPPPPPPLPAPPPAHHPQLRRLTTPSP